MFNFFVNLKFTYTMTSDDPAAGNGCFELQKFVAKTFIFRNIWKPTKTKLLIGKIFYLFYPRENAES